MNCARAAVAAVVVTSVAMFAPVSSVGATRRKPTVEFRPVLAQLAPEAVTTTTLAPADRVAAAVTVATCDDACPLVPGKRYLSWHLRDPKHEPLDGVREIRDEIDRRVRELVAELDGGGDRSAA